jgi:hypothetical protein
VKRVTKCAIIVFAAIIVTGCAHALSRPMPAVKGRLTLKVSQERPSKWNDMPIGVHQIPDTSVYISGHQGAAGIGVFFGPIGVAAAHAAAQQTGERKVQDVAAQLRLDIAAAAQQILTEELQRRSDASRFGLTGGAGDGSLEIVPYLVLTSVGDDQARPWVVLKTALKDSNGDEKWKTRYIASGGEIRPLGGENGWVSGDGEPLRKAVDRALRSSIDVLLRDASGQLPRGTGRTVQVKGHWVFVKEPLEIPAEILHETEEILIVNPKLADVIVFAGVNILDKKSVQVTVEPK